MPEGQTERGSGRDALRKYAVGIFLAKAESKLCLRPGPKAVERNETERAKQRRMSLFHHFSILENLFFLWMSVEGTCTLAELNEV